MIRVNLIPAERLERKRGLRHLRYASVGCLAYTVFLVIAFVVSRVVGAGDDRETREQLAAVDTAKLDTEKLVVSVQEELDRTVNALHANLAVGNQPNWGVLLALLADVRGDQIALSRCASTTGPNAASRMHDAGSADKRDTRNDVILEIQGVGQTQADVSQFVLRLDTIPLFRRVTLNDTRREPFLDGHATAFRLECDLETTKELMP